MFSILKIGKPLGTAYLAAWVYAIVAMLTACGPRAEEMVHAAVLEPGRYYTVRIDSGLHGVIRVNRIEDDQVSVTIFGNVYEDPPDRISESALHFRHDARTGDWAREDALLKAGIIQHMQPVVLPTPL